MDNFDLAYAFCSKHEFNAVKHYSNIASDPGGSTNWGITQRAYDTFRFRYPGFPASVRDLTEDQAKICDKGEYWPPWRTIQDDRVAAKCYDIGYNTGIGTATQYLQQAVGVTVDGHLGPLTLNATNADDPDAILSALVSLLAAHYQNWCAANPVRNIYLDGLLRRARDLPVIG